ncbi:MAG: hypothetical protein V7K42_01800 [Nostoc sp.]
MCGLLPQISHLSTPPTSRILRILSVQVAADGCEVTTQLAFVENAKPINGVTVSIEKMPSTKN